MDSRAVHSPSAAAPRSAMSRCETFHGPWRPRPCHHQTRSRQRQCRRLHFLQSDLHQPRRHRRTGAQVTDFLPSAVTFVSCSGGCTLIGNEIVWDIGDVNSGNSGSLAYEVMVDAGAAGGLSFTNHARS